MTSLRPRLLAAASLSVALTLAGTLMSGTVLAAPTGVMTVATIGEPPSLDPMSTTADLVGTITQHVFETLYAFDANWTLKPLLAAGEPVVSGEGKVWTIPLRADVRFHDGAAMTAEDVLASVKRWLAVSPRGKTVAAVLDEVSVVDGKALRFTLKKPFAPLGSLLAFNNGAAVVMPKAQAEAEGPLKSFVGTGPFKLVEHKPDQYIRLEAFAGYVSPAGEASGYAGKREAKVAELRFVPTPNAVTRLEGALSGQFLYSDALPTEMKARINGKPDVRPVVVKPFAWPFMIMNNKEGSLANATLRRAIQSALAPEDMLMAAFGDPEFFAVTGPFYGKGAALASTKGAEAFGTADTGKAKVLAKGAGYKGEPIRIMTSTQYDFLYKMSLVAQQQLEEAGFKVDLQVLDWATLVQRRNDPKQWDALFTYHTFVPEPSLLTIMNPAYAGWWETPEKTAALDAFNSDANPSTRAVLWGNLQDVFFKQAPTLKIGEFYSLAAASQKVDGLNPAPWPYFWNVSVK